MKNHYEVTKRDQRIRKMWLLDDMTPRMIAEQLMSEKVLGFKGKALAHAREMVRVSMERIRDGFATGVLDIETDGDPTAAAKITKDEREAYAAKLRQVMEKAWAVAERESDEYKIQTGPPDATKESKMSVRQIQLRKGPNVKVIPALDVFMRAATALAALRGVNVGEVTQGYAPERPARPVGVVVVRYPRADERDTDEANPAESDSDRPPN